ncbi:MAG TPA: hypothetical protein VF595_16050 [Tepidisphaeraceae bacterium]
MNPTTNIMGIGTVAPQIGVAVSFLPGLEAWLRVVSLLVGIAVGLSMLWFGWSRHRRHDIAQQKLLDKAAEAFDLHEAREYLQSERIRQRIMAIDGELFVSGVIPHAPSSGRTPSP